MGELSERVWRFWFGGASVGELLHTRWFPAEGRKGQQAVADAEVDAQFADTLRAALAGELDDWRHTPTTCVCLVVVLDQFSRHIYRHTGADRSAQLAADAKALGVAQHLLQQPGWVHRLSVPEHVFALFPLRHSATLERLNAALAQVDERSRTEESHVALLARFRKATLRRLQELQGKQWVQGDELLEHAAFAADETRLLREPLAQAVAAFMQRHNGGAAGAGQAVRACVSLSGGVDSMVLCTILSRLGRAAAPTWRVVGVHIDYGNRPESGAEAAYVEAWCRKCVQLRMQGVEFRVRTITEVQRGIADRDAYERESRRIRYDFYAACLDAFPGVQGVCVGHHSGDVAENVVTNLLKGTCLLAIAGMADVSTINGVPVWRPLLAFDKAAIFGFAHTYGVPYFRDTTPDWSTRGKLRRQLLPAMEAVFGDGILRTLADAGSEADQLAAMVESTLVQPFLGAAQVTDAGAWFDTGPWLSQPPLFWREALRRLCHSMGTGMVKDKAVTELLTRLRRGAKARDGWIPLKRDNKAYIHGTRVAIFSADMFPRPDAPPHFTAGTAVEPGVEYRWGPWRVVCSQADLPLDAACPPGPVSMQDVLSGSFSYAIPHPDDVDTGEEQEGGSAEVGQGPCGLRVAIAPRMPAFKGMQRRLRAALPLVVVGPDRDGTEDEGDVSGGEEDGHGPGQVPTFRVRAWTPAELAKPRCILVQISFHRTRWRDNAAGDGQVSGQGGALH